MSSRSGTHTGHPQPKSRRSTEARRLVRAAIAAFVVTCVVVIFASSRCSPKGQPGFALSQQARPQLDGTFSVTLDTKHRDRWVPFNLSTGKIAAPGTVADLRASRYLLQAPAGALRTRFQTLTDASLPEKPQWISDRPVDGQLQNAALSSWYRYSYLTHQLSPKGQVYAVRLASGAGVAYMTVESYYCAPEGSGCLTLRYRLDPEGV